MRKEYFEKKMLRRDYQKHNRQIKTTMGAIIR